MEDIHIFFARNGKATVASLTKRGYNWIKNNMTEESPVIVDSEAVDEIVSLIKADGLSVLERKR